MFLSTKYKSLKGFKENLVENYAYAFDGVEDVKLDGQIIGKYFRERNVLLVFFNPFEWDFEKCKDEYLTVHQDIVNAIKVCKIETVDVSDIGSKIVLEKFKERIKKRIEEIEKEVEKQSLNIKEFGEKLVFAYKEVTIQQNNAEGCKEMLGQMHATLLKEIEEIKKLKFVDKVELVEDRIEVHVGKVIIKGTHDGTEYITYAGDYTLHIKPGEVTITNADQIQKDDDGGTGMRHYGHPHINDTRPCFGDSGPMIHRLIAEFKLKDLVFQCMSYLKMYNDNSPHCRIDRYARARVAEGKFDQTGQLIR